ncbi:YqhV family protein [Fuchsiella alkaliacetigena]|uniref:YqhV family protein n=1 Tax=Fuchsiella alkaliacetigena TaxID=957042 RepID=UPI00200A5115|nr:YqhV family protein [Fuchsiella alkaliacetigena]MCK8823860.1 YqhV family protein [Fuchsiella alkaliacetigena]
MIFIRDKVVSSMALLRIISGIVELSAALLMLKFNSIEKALQINSALALVGPTVLVLVTAIGLAGISADISLMNFVVIALGVVLILIGIRL